MINGIFLDGGLYLTSVDMRLRRVFYDVAGSYLSVICKCLRSMQVVKASSSILFLRIYTVFGFIYNSVVHFSIKLRLSDGTYAKQVLLCQASFSLH